jgi:hypothetical protein
MVGEYVFSSAHNSNLTPKFTNFFYPSYFAAQKVSVAPRVSAIRKVIHTDGLVSGSSPITRAREARTVMPQFFRLLNTEEEHTLLVKGEEITTPQVIKESNFCVPGVHVH